VSVVERDWGAGSSMGGRWLGRWWRVGLRRGRGRDALLRRSCVYGIGELVSGCAEEGADMKG
jgi:hypothetical protein